MVFVEWRVPEGTGCVEIHWSRHELEYCPGEQIERQTNSLPSLRCSVDKNRVVSIRRHKITEEGVKKT